jgi:glycosyltransferase involved in cell wall biosynthesis
MSTIGIIMATYNGEKYLREQIESILSNTYTEWHLSIYDDGSIDQTFSIIKEYEEKYPGKITGYKNKENLGVKHNFLNAIKKEEYDYIMFCDQDDVWLSDKIEITYQKMLDVENKNPFIPITIFTDATLVDEKLNVLYDSYFRTSNLDVKKVDLSHILMENKLIGCTVMINKEVIQQLKIPTSPRMHDWWIAIITSSFGKIEFLDRPTILYRQHAANVIGGQDKISYIKNRISTLKKQKEVLKLTQDQAMQFYDLYKDQLSDKNRYLIKQFAELNKRNWFMRRYIILKDGYLKTGMVRNIGVLFII